MQQENKENLEAFAHRLNALADGKFSQAEIARQLGVTPQRVGNWFQSRNKPARGEDSRLAKLLGTSTEWLLDGTYSESGAGVSKVEEPRSSYTAPITSKALDAAARSYFEDVIAQASGDPARLGWVIEQLRSHLRPPPHWAASSNASSSPRKLSQLERIHLDDIARRAAQKDFREQHGVTPAPGEKATPTGEAAASSS